MFCVFWFGTMHTGWVKNKTHETFTFKRVINGVVDHAKRNTLAHLVPSQQFPVVLHSQDWLDDRDDEELEDEALLEERLELGEGVGDAEVGVGDVERVQHVAQLLEVILEGLQ